MVDELEKKGTNMLDQYTPDQLKKIIANIAPPHLIEWAEETGKDLTDSGIIEKYRFYTDGLRDYFTLNGEKMREAYTVLKDIYSQEETIEKMMDLFHLTHFEAKLYVSAQATTPASTTSTDSPESDG